MVSPPKVAVCLAAYNGMQWIEEQLDSILNQEKVEVTVFVSVDSSTDGTEAWVDERAREESRVVVLPHGCRFGSAARNFFRLLREVNFDGYDYVSLADQDDVWLPGKLIHAVSKIKAIDLGAYSSDVVAFWEGGREKLVKKSYSQKRFDHFFEAAGPGCTYVLKCELATAFQHFLNDNWEGINQVERHDWLIYAYSRQHKVQWLIDDQSLMRYRQHGGNQVGFNSGFKAWARRVKLIRQHWYRQQVKKIISLVGDRSHPQVSLSYPFLIRNFWNLRRRPRDAWALLLFVLFGLF